MPNRLIAAALLMLVGLAPVGCGEYESCDPGQRLQNRICFGAAADAGASGAGGAPAAGMCNVPRAPAADADVGDAGAAAGPMCAGSTPGFGQACLENGDCACGTTLCARQPGQACGFCTKRDCLMDKALCPAGWSCFDATAFQPGLSLCVQM
jgi:hypothetical protein